MVALVNHCSQKSDRRKLLRGREETRERKRVQFRCMDAKQAMLLGLHACKMDPVCFSEQCRCDPAEQGPEAEGGRTPGHSCCRAPAASWHLAVCKFNSSSCLRAGIWPNLMPRALTEAKVSHGVSLEGWGLHEQMEKLQWVHFYLPHIFDFTMFNFIVIQLLEGDFPRCFLGAKNAEGDKDLIFIYPESGMSF